MTKTMSPPVPRRRFRRGRGRRCRSVRLQRPGDLVASAKSYLAKAGLQGRDHPAQERASEGAEQRRGAVPPREGAARARRSGQRRDRAAQGARSQVPARGRLSAPCARDARCRASSSRWFANWDDQARADARPQRARHLAGRGARGARQSPAKRMAGIDAVLREMPADRARARDQGAACSRRRARPPKPAS